MSHTLTTCFSGYCWGLDESTFIVLGAPLEETVSYRPGTRFAPRAVREASAYIEYWSLRASLDVDEEAKFHDAGDALVDQPLAKALDAIPYSVERLACHEKPIIVIGGEHTVTLGVVRGLAAAGYKTCVVQLDAHLDMRGEYAGRRLSHATFARRLIEEIGAPYAVLGYRAVTREELDYARAKKVVLVDARRLDAQHEALVYPLVSRFAERGCNHLHLTLDMDVVEPGLAPGVSNPEPDGVSVRTLLDTLFDAVYAAVSRGMSVSMDVVEVSPPYDCGGVTSVLAARSIVEFAAAVLAARRRG